MTRRAFLAALGLGVAPAPSRRRRARAAGALPPPGGQARRGLRRRLFLVHESDFDGSGVLSTTSGYIGGRIENPTYEQVSGGGTGHIESVQVLFDPRRVSYPALVDHFFRTIDPLDGGGQFCDRGEVSPPRFSCWTRSSGGSPRRPRKEVARALAEAGRDADPRRRAVLAGGGLPPGLLPEEPGPLPLLSLELADLVGDVVQIAGLEADLQRRRIILDLVAVELLAGACPARGWRRTASAGRAPGTASPAATVRAMAATRPTASAKSFLPTRSTLSLPRGITRSYSGNVPSISLLVSSTRRRGSGSCVSDSATSTSPVPLRATCATRSPSCAE